MKGQQPFAGLFGQFIRETTPGTYDPTGERFILTCLKCDFQPDEAWDNFRPDGVSEDAWHALSKEWQVVTAQVAWDYRQCRPLLEMAIGQGILTDPAPTDALETGYALPAFGSRDVSVFTFEWGTPNSCDRCPYLFMTAISHNADRDGTRVDGQITFMCRKPVASGVPMTGAGDLSNAILAITGQAVTDDGVFSLQVQGEEAQDLTISIDDTEADIEGKLDDLGITATVDGTIASASGELHILTAAGATGNATIYGDVTVTPGMTALALQGLIRAKGGDKANVNVSGSTTTPGATYTISGAPDTSFNGTYSLTTDVHGGDLDGVPTYKNANSRYLSEAGAGQGWKLQNATQFADALGGGAFTYRRGAAGTPDTPAIDDWVNPAVEDVAIHVVESTIASSGAYNIQFPVGVGNVTDITSTPGTGWSTSVTPIGDAGGSITITVTAPASKFISLTKKEGAGYGSSILQAGSDGKLRIPTRTPILPSHFGLRIADTRDGLAAASLVQGVKKASWSYEALAEAVFFAMEGNTSFQAHSDDPEGRKGTWTLVVAASSPLNATLVAKKAKSPSEPFWVELRETYETNVTLAKWQGYVAVSAPTPVQAAGKVRAFQYTLTPVLDDLPFNEDVASLIEDGGASFYAVVRESA